LDIFSITAERAVEPVITCMERAVLWPQRGGGGNQQGAADGVQCWLCPARRVAVPMCWPQLALADSVAEGDKDAICHITCSKAVPSGCLAGVSHKPLCPEGSARHRCGAAPQELSFLWKEPVEVAQLSVLGCTPRGQCHLHLFLLYA